LDYDKRKNEILTEYVNSKKLTTLKYKIRNICFRYYVTDYSKIAEDVLAEVLLQLAKYNSEKLVTAFEENPNSLEGISVRIAQRCFTVKKKSPDNPNHSFGTKLLHTSTFKSFNSISHTETYDDSEQSDELIIYDGGGLDTTITDKLELIKERLTAKEIDFLERLMNKENCYVDNKTGTKKFKSFKEFKDYLYMKIQDMDLDKPLSELEKIRTKLDREDLHRFDIMFNEDLSMKDKMSILKYKEGKYFSQRRILLKKIRSIKND
jgi:hypothetical protein